MKDILIRSQDLLVAVNAWGAEIKSVEKNGMEYLWQGEKGIYQRTSPTLFPIVGRFLSDTYYVGDRDYRMELNGIAMEENFDTVSLSGSSVTFLLKPNRRTMAAYPFDFGLYVTYTADKSTLRVDYRVENNGPSPMPFCVGCHTAYRWPLRDKDAPEDYRLVFEQEEQLRSFNPFGWRQDFVNGRVRPLSHSLFANYTRSITDIRSEWIQLESTKHSHGVRIHRSAFPYMAIWTLPIEEARLVCLEPCTGIHAGDTGCTHLEDREGAIVLAPGEVWEKGSVSISSDQKPACKTRKPAAK